VSRYEPLSTLRQLALNDVQVRATDAARGHLDEDFIGRGNGLCDLDKLKRSLIYRSGLSQNESAHGESVGINRRTVF
jgi:hypothetical protein